MQRTAALFLPRPRILQKQDPAWKGDFCNRSYSLEELTRLSYAYEDIMLERTFAAERLYLRERGPERR